MSEKSIYYWRIYCNTDAKNEYIWHELEPTTCPINAGHSIDGSKTAYEQELIGYQIDDTDSPYQFKHKTRSIVCDTSSGNITLKLKKASRVNTSLPLIIVKTSDSNTITVDGYKDELVDGSTTKDITAKGSYKFSSNGSTWSSVDNAVSQYLSDTSYENISLYSIQPEVRRSRYTSWKTCATFEYGGSNVIGEIRFIDVVAKMQNGASGFSVRIVNQDTGQVICQNTSSTNKIYESIDLGIVSNIPTDISILQLQIKRNGGSNKWIYIQQILIYYETN